MTGIDKFIDIFGGSFSAYGQTRKTDEFDDRGKHKTKSFIIKKTPSTKMFQDHLDGQDIPEELFKPFEGNQTKITRRN